MNNNQHIEIINKIIGKKTLHKEWKCTNFGKFDYLKVILSRIEKYVKFVQIYKIWLYGLKKKISEKLPKAILWLKNIKIFCVKFYEGFVLPKKLVSIKV